MNIKKHMLKPVWTMLVFATVLSNLLVSSAAEVLINESPIDEAVTGGSGWTVDESRMEEIEVTYRQPSSYYVTIPKTIVLDAAKQAAYSVKVTGDIDASQRVYVAPADGIASTESIDFYMKDQAAESKKADVLATVKQNKFFWNSEEVAVGYEETSNLVSAPNLTAGTWKGTFQMEIHLESSASHTHNYVDGVCTGCGAKDPNAEHEHNYIDGICDGCGAADPNHEHNYVDGICTICGGKTDPYEVAPASEYIDWTYTLDDTDKTITLIQYIGTATDVIVYSNYEIGGTRYKTRLASYQEGSNYYMFYGKDKVKSIKFGGGIDMSQTTSLKNMFYACRFLADLDISRLDTSNVTDMSYMFMGCFNLPSLDLSNFDTSNVTDMSYMFRQCGFTSIDLSSFDTSNVMDMSYMFMECKKLEKLDLSNINTQNVTNMFSMFGYCEVLTDIDLSNFNTENVTDMSYMFGNCYKLPELDLSNFDTVNVTSMAQMFTYCSALTSINLSSFDTGKVTDMRSMFNHCPLLSELDLSSFDTHNVKSSSTMFDARIKPIYITDGKWTLNKTSNMIYK